MVITADRTASPPALRGAYAASKAAAQALAMTLSREVAELGITVNCVAPGPLDTPGFREDVERLARMTGKDPAAISEDVGKALPLGRLTDPEEAAAVVSFLLSPEASGITGTVIPVG